MWPVRSSVDTASAGDQTTTPGNAPSNDKSGSASNAPEKTLQPATDKPAAPGDSIKPTAPTTTTPTATPTTPTTTADQKTPSSDSSAVGTPANPGYIVVGAKIIKSTVPGKLGDPEPGALISLNVTKYPLRRNGDTGTGPQDGHDADRTICITISDGSCEMKITNQETPYYGLDKVTAPRIDLAFDSMVYRGGFNVVGKDTPKIDKIDGGMITDTPYAFKIGDTTVVRHSFTSPYGATRQLPKKYPL